MNRTVVSVEAGPHEHVAVCEAVHQRAEAAHTVLHHLRYQEPRSHLVCQSGCQAVSQAA